MAFVIPIITITIEHWFYNAAASVQFWHGHYPNVEYVMTALNLVYFGLRPLPGLHIFTCHQISLVALERR